MAAVATAERTVVAPSPSENQVDVVGSRSGQALARSVLGGREPRVVTAPAARSASSVSHRTSAARKASLAARSQKRREAADNPKCPNCGARTIQNAPEGGRQVFWCARCQRYPFGSGFGSDRIQRFRDEGDV